MLGPWCKCQRAVEVRGGQDDPQVTTKTLNFCCWQVQPSQEKPRTLRFTDTSSTGAGPTRRPGCRRQRTVPSGPLLVLFAPGVAPLSQAPRQPQPLLTHLQRLAQRGSEGGVLNSPPALSYLLQPPQYPFPGAPASFLSLLVSPPPWRPRPPGAPLSLLPLTYPCSGAGRLPFRPAPERGTRSATSSSPPVPRPYREQFFQRAPHRHDLQLAFLHLHGLRLATLQTRPRLRRREPQGWARWGLRLHRHSQAPYGRHRLPLAAPLRAHSAHPLARAPPPLATKQPQLLPRASPASV